MKKNLVHIAVSPDVLGSLIERNYIHAVDFKCLDSYSKLAVWKLFLRAMITALKDKQASKEKPTYGG